MYVSLMRLNNEIMSQSGQKGLIIFEQCKKTTVKSEASLFCRHRFLSLTLINITKRSTVLMTCKEHRFSKVWMCNKEVRNFSNSEFHIPKRSSRLSPPYLFWNQLLLRGRPQRTSANFSLFLTPTPLMSATVCISRTPP